MSQTDLMERPVRQKRPGGRTAGPRSRACTADWTVPVRHHYSIPMPNEPEQTLLLMPAWEAGQAIGMKLATITPGNGPRGFPAVKAVYQRVDGPPRPPRAADSTAQERTT